MPRSYPSGCLAVVRALYYSTSMTREEMAQNASLSVTGACARFRNLRKFGCEAKCWQYIMPNMRSQWRYRLVHVPKDLRVAAGIT